MLQYAVHAYSWTDCWTLDSLDLIDRAKSIGFDLIEIPLMDLERIDSRAIRRRLKEVGLGVCTSTACSLETDPTGDDLETLHRAEHYLKRCVLAAAEMGASLLTGVIYSAIGRRLDGMPTSVYWERSAQVLRTVARFAADHGVALGIEPVNRYETFLVNTCAQALKLIEMIAVPNVYVHLDAFHMNLEERDFYEATRMAVPWLAHFHLSESHRGTVGTGLVDWRAIYAALAEGGYQGIVGLESFVKVSPAMAAATCIWRRLAESPDRSLREGLAYLRTVEAESYALYPFPKGPHLPVM